MISLTSPIETWAHRVPAGAKLAALSVATVGLFLLDDPVWLGAAVLAVAALTLTGGWDFARAAARALRILIPFLALIALWHAVTGQVAAGLVVALRLLAAHVVTPLVNLQFIWMVAIGALAFGELPSVATWLGGAVVIASGLYLVWEQFAPTAVRSSSDLQTNP